MACQFNVNQAYKESTRAFMNYVNTTLNGLLNMLAVSLLLNNSFEPLKEMFEGMEDSSNVNAFLTKFRDFVIKRYNSLTGQSIDTLPDLELANLNTRFLQTIKGTLPDTSTEAQSVEMLTSSAESRNPKEQSNKFILEAYGTAEDIAAKALLDVKKGIFDVCFLNRGLTGMRLEPVMDEASLNRNIRRHHQYLLDTIIDYVRTLPDVPADLRNYKLYRTFNGVTTATSTWGEKLLPYLKRKFIYTPSELQRLDSKALNAYNAYVFLNNYDNCLQHIFGDAIRINNRGFKDGKDRYSFAAKTSNLNTSFRKDDGSNINVAQESDKITKLLIETTEILHNGVPTGKYLTFNDYSYLVSILKLNTVSPEFKNLIFEASYILDLEDLSQKTKDFISDKSFAEIVASLRINHAEVMPIISELYLKGFLNDLTMFKDLNTDHKDKMETIMSQLYGQGKKSIFNLTDFLNPNNIYNNLCLQTDSIFRNVLTLTYQDQDGLFYERLMEDMSEWLLANNIKQSINQGNSPMIMPTNFKDYFTAKYGYMNLNLTGDNANFIFFLKPLDSRSQILLKINSKTEDVEYIIRVKNSDGTTLDKNLNTLDYEELNQLVKYTKDLSKGLIGIDFNTSVWDNFVSKSNAAQAVDKLIKYCGRILSRIYVSNTLIGLNDSSYAALKKLETFYGEDFQKNIGFDKARKQVNLYGNTLSDKNIISELASAQLEYLGLTTAAQINNSERKAQSLASFSKLLCTYGIQFQLLEKLSGSVTQDLDIIKENWFLGVSIVNEVYSRQSKLQNKPVSLSPSEIAQSSILIDYLPAAFGTSALNDVGFKGIASFLASVNSDKNTMDKLRANLNSTFVDKNGTTVSYKDATTSLLLDKLSENLGSYYSNMLTKVYLDLEALREYIPVFLSKYGYSNPNLPIDVGLDYFNNFAQFNTWLSLFNIDNGKNITGELFLYSLTMAYNNSHDNKIGLVLNIHVNYIDGIPHASNTVLALVFRYGYRPSDNIVRQSPYEVNTILSTLFARLQMIEADPDAPLSLHKNWSTLEQFINMRNWEYLGDLLDSNTVFNLKSLNADTLSAIKELFKDWIDDSDNLILAKVALSRKSDGTPIYKDIVSKLQLGQVIGLKNSIVQYGLRGEVVLNPILEKHSLLHTLFTQQWMFTTVGSFVAHPMKNPEYLNDAALRTLVAKNPWLVEMFLEATQYNAQCKRNVSFTAQMLQFALNGLFGTTEDYNIAVIEDMVKKVDVLTSSGNKVKPFDGATIVDPFTMLLENNSLAGNKSTGETKKSFVHFKNPRVGNGGIIKTAVFALTNSNMRMSLDLNLNLMYKMSSNIWKDLLGNEIIWNVLESDLLKDSLGLPLSLVPKNLYYTKGRKYYQILDIKNVEDTNDYIRTEIEVNYKGEALNNQTREVRVNGVNSNVKLWELFGGLYSMENNGKKLVMSEQSISAVVDCMNHKGFLKRGVTKPKSLFDFYLPMKHSQIHYVVTEGAIKQGAENVNDNSHYRSASPLSVYAIKMLQGGTLLDKEHHADLSEVSVPTLVISACALAGITFQDAETLYNGVATIAELALDDMLKTVESGYKTLDFSEFLGLCTETIVKNLVTSKSLNFGSFIALNILNAAKSDEGKSYLEAKGLVISDNTIFNRSLNIVSNYLTKNAIKLKMPGTLSIMTPSSGRALLFGDRKLSAYQDPFRDVLQTQIERYDSNPVYDSGRGSVANVEPGREYTILIKKEGSSIGELVEIDGIRRLPVSYNGKTYYFSGQEINDASKIRLFDDRDGNPVYVPFFAESISKDDPNQTSNINRRALFLAILNKTKERRPITRIETLEEYNLRIASEAMIEFNKVIEHPSYEIQHVKVDVNGKNGMSIFLLRELVESGKVAEITEYIMNGRDLGSYNVRFKGYFKQEITISDEEAESILNASFRLDPPEISNAEIDAKVLELGLDLYGHIAEYFAYYDVSDPTNKINWESIRNEIIASKKSKGHDNNLDGYKWFTRVNGGVKLSLVIHSIYETLHDTPGFETLTDLDIRNAIIEYLASNDLSTKTKSKEVYRSYLHDTYKDLTETWQEYLYLLQSPPKDLMPEEFKLRLEAIKLANKTITDTSDRFSLWELKSVQDAWTLNAIKNRTPELELQYKEVRKQMKRDMLVLSKAAVDSVSKLDELIASDKDLSVLKKKLDSFLKLQLVMNKNSDIANISTKEEFDLFVTTLKEQMNQIVIHTNLGDRVVLVDRSSVEHLDYEIIMPKVFATFFDLEGDTSVAEIANNRMYFVEKAIEKQGSILNPALFSMEIKSFDGKHRYIAIDNNFNTTGLVDATQVVPQMTDEMGVIWYLDEKDNKVFEIKEGTKIYKDSFGTEIIVLGTLTSEDGTMSFNNDDLLYYLNVFNGSEFKFSDSLLNSQLAILNSVFEVFKLSKWSDKMEDTFDDVEVSSILEFINEYNKLPKLTKDSIKRYIELSRKVKNKTISLEESKELNVLLRSPVFIDGMERYNAFMESLKVIAARIPALSMQSFMAMKVRDFVDGDKNTAYVSDLLIFLQGSDFDIDSVTILTFDINSQGKIELWSPFAITHHKGAFEASKKLPYPTNKRLLVGESTETLTSEVTNDLEKLFNFFELYKSLLNFEIKDGKFSIKKKKNGKLAYKLPRFNRNVVSLLNSINSLLREKIIYYPEMPTAENEVISVDDLKNKIVLHLKENYKDREGNPYESIEISNEELENIYKVFLEIINWHNTYLTNKKLVDSNKLHRITNNSNMNAMYNIITDAGNLMQSMISVDTVTKPVQALSKTTPKATQDLYNGIGNPFVFGRVISGNYTGKDCIAKSASTLKCYFKITHYYNKLLNSLNTEQQNFLRLPEDLLNAFGEYKPTVANIRAVDPYSIVNPEALNNLIDTYESGNMESASDLLSALLGLSADNAKELVLDKINAGIDLIGLYLYGISIGFTIQDLSKVLISNTTKVLLEAMAGEFINNKRNTTIDDIFDYFRYGPKNDIREFNVGSNFKAEGFARLTPIVSVLYKLAGFKNILYSPITYKGKSKNKIGLILATINNGGQVDMTNSDLGLAITLIMLALRESRPSEFNNILDTILNELMNEYSAEDRFNTQQILRNAIQFLKTYYSQFYLLTSLSNHRVKFTDEFHALRLLSIGSKSMRTIGSIVGLNLGIPSDLDGILRKVQTIENYINDMAELKSKLTGRVYPPKRPFKLVDFLYNNELKELYILEAESYKVNFNLLHMIDTLPDLKKYVQALNFEDLYHTLKSNRYRFIKELSNDLKKYYMVSDETINNGLSRFILNIYILRYLKSLPFKFKPLKKFVYGEIKDNLDGSLLGLTSNHEIAAFKYWMEHEVIPALLTNSLYLSNKFIAALKPSSRNNTISGNEILVYSLPINMMAEPGSNDALLFNEYLESFNGISFKYNGYDVKELFFYYTLIAHEWKPSRNSLMNLFKNMKLLCVNDYYNFISILDSHELVIDDPNYFALYLASHNRYKDRNAKFVWVHNPDLGKYQLYLKNSESSEEDYDPAFDGEEDEYYGFSVLGYHPSGNNYDSNYYVFGSEVYERYKRKPVSDIITYNNEQYNVRRINGEITDIIYNGKAIATRGKLSRANVISIVDGNEVVDLETYLKSVEESEEQVCEIQ